MGSIVEIFFSGLRTNDPKRLHYRWVSVPCDQSSDASFLLYLVLQTLLTQKRYDRLPFSPLHRCILPSPSFASPAFNPCDEGMFSGRDAATHQEKSGCINLRLHRLREFSLEKFISSESHALAVMPMRSASTFRASFPAKVFLRFPLVL